MVCCPAEKMIAEYSSKPTWEASFVCQHNVIQGIREEDFASHMGWSCRVLERYDLWGGKENYLERL